MGLFSRSEFWASQFEDAPQTPDEIVSVMSHELRTSLTSIQAALGLLHTGMLGTLPEKGQRMLEIALSNTDRLMHFIEAIECDLDRSIHPALPQAFTNETTNSLAQKLLPLKLWRQQVYYDKLTGLPTQALLIDWLQQSNTLFQEQSKPFALLFINLDRFRLINDSLGHEVGDQLLVEIAERLITCLPAAGAVARLPADQFVVLLENIQNIKSAVSVAECINKVLAIPFQLQNQNVSITASIGISWSDKDYKDPEDLLHNAETAMYQAKALGRARYDIFDAKVRLELTSRLRLEADLHLAIERHELQVYYQPIVSLTTNIITGFEALVRWQHPKLGLISPEKFIPLAEETGLIHAIGQVALREACQQLHTWQQQFPAHSKLSVSVNLAASQFSQTNLVEQVQQILQETKLNPQSLKLEITESALMENPETAAKMLQQLKSLGIQIYLDDFGTGYSSLAYLHRFPIDTLKIDRSFVSRIGEGEQLEIVWAIIKLAWNLGLSVVAEGVETSKQLAQLKSLRCNYAQGYFFSRPVSSEFAEQLLSQGLTSFVP